MRIMILGAGPTGLGAARRLAELGHDDWELWEGAPEAGGLAGSVTDDHGFVWDMGGHVQFSHYAKFDALMDEALGPEGWLEHERESWIRIRGGWVPYPFQYNLHRLPKEDALRCFQGLIDASRTSRPDKYANFEQMIQGAFGGGIADLFMMPYNFKVWAYPPRELTADWIGERVAIPDLKRVAEALVMEKDDVSWGPNNTFRFPKHGGTGAIWRAVAAGLPQERLKFGKRVERIDPDAKTVHATDGSSAKYDALISTLPLDRLAELAGRDDLVQAARGLRYSSTHIYGVGLHGAPGPDLAKKCWMYFPEDDCPFYRVTVFSHYSPNNVPDIANQWSLMAEVSESSAKPVDAAQLEEEVVQGMINTGLITGRDQVHHVWKTRLERGYPTPSLGRDAALATLLPELERLKIYSRGRFGAWKYEVSNQDHSCMQGMEAVDRLLGGGEEPTLHEPNVVNGMKFARRADTKRDSTPAKAQGPSILSRAFWTTDRVRRILSHPAGLFAAYFLLVATVLHRSFMQGFTSDAIGYMCDACEMISRHPWRPYMDPIPHNDPGHPLMMTWIVGWIWIFLDHPTWPAHLLVWMGAALALMGTHRVATMTLVPGESRPRREFVGVLAALMLFSHPLFAGTAAQFLSEVPLTGFSAALMLAALRHRRNQAIFWGVLLLFQKATGVVTLAAFGLVRLFECLLDARTRQPRVLLRESAPYILPLIPLAVYFAIKLYVLKQPLTTFDSNWGWNTTLEGMKSEWEMVWNGMINTPRVGIGLLLPFVAGAGLFRLFQAIRGGYLSRRPVMYLHFLNFTLCATSFLFYTFHRMWDHPRYHILLYPTLILAALDGVLLLVARRLPAAAVLAGAWMALLLIRWNPDTIEPLRKPYPNLHGKLYYTHADLSPIIMKASDALKRTVRRLSTHHQGAFIFSIYPVGQAIFFERAGYLDKPFPADGAPLPDISDKQAFLSDANSLRKENQEVLVVLSSLLGDARRIAKDLETWPEIETVRTEKFPGDGWVNIYRLRLPPKPAPPPEPPIIP